MFSWIYRRTISKDFRETNREKERKEERDQQKYVGVATEIKRAYKRERWREGKKKRTTSRGDVMRALCVECEFFIALGETSGRRRNDACCIIIPVDDISSTCCTISRIHVRECSFGLENARLKNWNNP